MTKHLTKPIRAFHFMVLAFLMTIGSQVSALELFKAGDQFFCDGKQNVTVSALENRLINKKPDDSLVQIKSKSKVVVNYKRPVFSTVIYDIVTIEAFREQLWVALSAEYQKMSLDRGKPAVKYKRILFNGKTLTEVTHLQLGVTVATSECQKI